MGNSPDVRVRLSAEGEASIIAAFKKIQAQAETTGRVGSRGLGALSDAAAGLGRLLPALSFGAVIAGATAMAKRALETADNFAKLSQKTGVSVETLSGFAHGADLAGVSTEELAKGLGKLARAAAGAAEGGEAARAPFEALGISVKNQQGGLRSLDDLLGDVADSFAKMPDGARKAALAQELFGKSGADMIPLLNQGRAGLAEMKAEAEKLGLVFDTKTALAAEAFNDNLRRLRATVEGFVNREMAALLPQLSEFIAKVGLVNLEIKEWELRLESAGMAAAGAARLLLPTPANLAKAQGFFANATQAAEEAALVEAQWNAELSKSLAALAKLGQQPKRTGTEPPIADEAARGKSLDAIKKLADAKLAATRAGLDNELALVKANIAATSAEEQKAFAEGLRDIEVFFGNRRAMLEFEASKEIMILEKEAAAIQARIDEVTKRPLKKGELPAEREAEALKLQTDLAKVQTEIEVRRSTLVGQRVALEGEQRDATRQFNQEVLKSEADLAEAEGNRFAAARIELEAQIAGMKRLAGETDATFAERQRILREAGESAIRFQETQAQARRALSDIEAQRTQIELLVRRGVLTEFEGQRTIAQLEKDRLPQLEKIADAMKAAAVTPEEIEAARQFSEQIEQLAASSDLAGQRMAELKKSIEGALASDLANFFSRGIDEATSFGDAMRELARSVVESLREIASQMLANLIIQQAMAGFGKIAGFSLGGFVPAGEPIAAAGGGLVRGPGTGTSDDVPIWASSGEFVMREAVVSKPGMLEFLEDLNSFATLQVRPIGRYRGFAAGGLVEPESQSAGRAGSVALQVGLEEGTLIRRLDASREFGRVVVKKIGEYRNSVKAALGR